MKRFIDVNDCSWINDCFYVLKENKTLEIYDKNYNLIDKKVFKNKYSHITCNSEENVFYLSYLNSIYKSTDLKKFIKIDLPICLPCEIIHIYFCKCYEALIITTKCKIYMYEIKKKKISVIYEVKQDEINVNDCIHPLGCINNLKIVLLKAICCCEDIYIVYQLNGFYFVSKLEDLSLKPAVYKTKYVIKSIFIKDKKLCVLLDKNCNLKVVCLDVECECSQDKHEDCKCEIVESIAIVEKSLAKILGSEALKIKAAIGKAEDIKELICVNSSVKELIYIITILEFILTEKLKTVSDDKCC